VRVYGKTLTAFSCRKLRKISERSFCILSEIRTIYWALWYSSWKVIKTHEAQTFCYQTLLRRQQIVVTCLMRFFVKITIYLNDFRLLNLPNCIHWLLTCRFLEGTHLSAVCIAYDSFAGAEWFARSHRRLTSVTLARFSVPLSLRKQTAIRFPYKYIPRNYLYYCLHKGNSVRCMYTHRIVGRPFFLAEGRLLVRYNITAGWCR
jgi:hypothetical protein